jgi:hypothetical protein
VKPERGGTSGKALQLMAADSAASAYGDDTGAVEECPLKKKEKESGRARVLLWHVSELGGGVRWGAKRSDAAIDAFATVIAKSEADLCVLMGLRRTEAQLVQKTLSDGSTAMFREVRTEETGVAEVKRIVDALGRADGAGGWQAAFVKDGSDTLYQRGTSVAFLYKSAKGITLDGVTLVHGERDEQLGLSGELACAAFTVTLRGKPVKLPLLAPLAAGALDPAEKPPATHGEVPEQCVLVLSLPYELAEDPSRLASFRSVVDAEYLPLPNAGSVPRQSYWDEAFEHCEAFIDNPLTLNRVDARLHDDYMNWRALPLPRHPDALDRLVGRLSDLVVLKNGTAKPIKVEDLRVLDLVRASLTDETAARGAEAGATPLEKDRLLAPLLSKLKEAAKPLDSSKKNDAVNAVHASLQLTRLLSDHSPVLLLLSVED